MFQRLNGHSAPPKVLILENNAHLLRLYTSLLACAGYDVAQAMTTAEARAALRRGRYDLLICAMYVGRERGMDFVREKYITLISGDTQVVMVSGDERDRALCEEIGVKFLLAKSGSANELLALADRLSGRSGNVGSQFVAAGAW